MIWWWGDGTQDARHALCRVKYAVFSSLLFFFFKQQSLFPPETQRSQSPNNPTVVFWGSMAPEFVGFCFDFGRCWDRCFLSRARAVHPFSSGWILLDFVRFHTFHESGWPFPPALMMTTTMAMPTSTAEAGASAATQKLCQWMARELWQSPEILEAAQNPCFFPTAHDCSQIFKKTWWF